MEVELHWNTKGVGYFWFLILIGYLFKLLVYRIYCQSQWYLVCVRFNCYRSCLAFLFARSKLRENFAHIVARGEIGYCDQDESYMHISWITNVYARLLNRSLSVCTRSTWGDRLLWPADSSGEASVREWGRGGRRGDRTRKESSSRRRRRRRAHCQLNTTITGRRSAVPPVASWNIDKSYMHVSWITNVYAWLLNHNLCFPLQIYCLNLVNVTPEPNVGFISQSMMVIKWGR